METSSSSYDEGFRPLTFHDRRAAFLDGGDTPREYLERCLAQIEIREPVVRAWVSLNVEGARAAADASTERYRSARPLSAIDGMPIGVKDLIQTKDLPTEQGSPIFKGVVTGYDSASIRALRDAGALILGKTVTTEFGMSHPGPTTNPFDPERIPGGSSSGSAAAVGAAMVPVAIGTQLLASIVRPAGFCANYAIKPTLGALNRGERLGNSHAHLGVHAGCLADMWHVAHEIGVRAGGDPGYPGLFSGPELSSPRQPDRLVVIETEAWSQVEPKTAEAFEKVLSLLGKAGVSILRRADDQAIEAFERAISDNMAMCRVIVEYEIRWTLQNLYEKHSDKLSESIISRVKRSQDITRDDYRQLLLRREEARRRFAALAPLADATISLTSISPAPGFGDTSGSAQGILHSTGTPALGAPFSMLGVPSIVIPRMSVGGMPVGIQLCGQANMDERLSGIARWVSETLPLVKS